MPSIALLGCDAALFQDDVPAKPVNENNDLCNLRPLHLANRKGLQQCDRLAVNASKGSQNRGVCSPRPRFGRCRSEQKFFDLLIALIIRQNLEEFLLMVRPSKR